MKLFPAIDIYEGCAVRLYKGDYTQMTVYSDNPPEFAAKFAEAGATCLHLVDLEGAKLGTTPNLETVKNIISVRTFLLLLSTTTAGISPFLSNFNWSIVNISFLLLSSFFLH